VTTQLTSRPVVVVNSHTHNDHVGGNWQFAFVYGWIRLSRAPMRELARRCQAEITPDQICGNLPKEFDARAYVTKPWKISRTIGDGFKINLGGRTLEILSVPGHTPDAIALLDGKMGCCSQATRIIPLRLALSAERISMRTRRRSKSWRCWPQLTGAWRA